jgi:hypothetical protein
VSQIYHVLSNGSVAKVLVGAMRFKVPIPWSAFLSLQLGGFVGRVGGR